MTTRYEFYFNEEYALEHNPALMGIGTSGGYGYTRVLMRCAVENGNMPDARIHFFELCQQTYEETADDALEIGCTVDDLLNQWHTSIMEHPYLDQNKEIWFYLRSVVMEDSQMDMHPDPMVIPTLATIGWVNDDCKSYAEDLRLFIEWVHESGAVDPMDATCIY